MSHELETFLWTPEVFKGGIKALEIKNKMVFMCLNLTVLSL